MIPIQERFECPGAIVEKVGLPGGWEQNQVGRHRSRANSRYSNCALFKDPLRKPSRSRIAASEVLDQEPDNILDTVQHRSEDVRRDTAYFDVWPLERGGQSISSYRVSF